MLGRSVKFVDALCYHFEAQMQCLTELNLSHNEFTDTHVSQILDTFTASRNSTLRKLHFSGNKLTDAFVPSLVEVFQKYDCKLEELYLAWNKITQEGGCLIADCLLDADFLKVLDLSWNRLNVDNEGKRKFSKQFKTALSKNVCLLHLDLSFNRIDLVDTQTIAQGLEENHTMFGFHYRGNSGKVDSLGHLKPSINNTVPELGSHHFIRPINGTNPLLKGLNKDRLMRAEDKYLISDGQDRAFGEVSPKKNEYTLDSDLITKED